MKNKVYEFIKRLFDLVVSFVGCMFLIPIILIVKIVSLISGDFNSIFYSQTRIGQQGKEFKLFKFRSMVVNADKELDKILEANPELKEEYTINKKLKHDPRVTKIGRILRRSNIDELPQVINVLMNQMSIVGNRPYLPKEIKDIDKDYQKIVKYKPGITGLWQTSGRKDRTFKYRCNLEAEYSEIRSLSVDIKILLKTIKIVFKGD